MGFDLCFDNNDVSESCATSAEIMVRKRGGTYGSKKLRN